MNSQIPWNKGKTGISEEYRHKLSEAGKGNQRALGYHHTDEAKRRMSEAAKGRIPWNKGKQLSAETCRKMSEAKKGCKRSPFSLEYRRGVSIAKKHLWQNSDYAKKMSEAAKRRCQDPDYVRKWIASNQIKSNRAERKLDAILQKVCPDEFALNVKANIMVLGGKIPDFVNVNGKKQLIELFGDYWHNPNYFPDRQSSQERIDYFRQFGFDTLIVWEHELKDEAALKQKLLTFIG